MKILIGAALVAAVCATQARAEEARWMARETSLRGYHPCGHSGERYDVTISGDSFRAVGMEKGDHFYGKGFRPDGSSRTTWTYNRVTHTIDIEPGTGPRKITITTSTDCLRVHEPISDNPPPIQEITWKAYGADSRRFGAQGERCLDPEIKWTFRVVNGGLHAVDDTHHRGFGLDKLNPDGSGHVSTKQSDTSYNVVDVEPGAGPRRVRYRWGAVCDVMFEP